MKNLKKTFKDYFAFSKSERRGVFVLLVILLLIITINILLPYLVTRQKIDLRSFEANIANWDKTKEVIAKKQYSYQKKENHFDFNNSDKSAADSKLTPFNFNPNNLPDEKWKEIGLTDKQIKVIKNFETKGGKFYKKEDLKKMFCISENEYKILEPYIEIPETHNNLKAFKEFKKPEPIKVELNTASPEDLEKLKGFGQYFSKSIIKYRDVLGGYYKVEQLHEVYHLDSARYEQIKPQVTIDAQYISKIDVNTAEFDVLKKHPYIGYNVALSLTNYRKVHGKFKQLSEIKKSALITDALYQKISPYLKVE
jgi:competence ComEA-like helix-hairpin-helix protein